MYLDASVVIDIMKLENNIRMNKEKRELARINRDRMRSLNYSLTMLVVAVGEVIRFIKEINDDRKRKSCVEWFWKFLEENNIDVLPIVRDVVFIDDDNCVFKIAKDIIRGECSNPNDWWGGRTLDGNDALILAQAILDDEVSAILTTDSRMLQATTIHDIIGELKERGKLGNKKLKIIDDLSDFR